MNYENTSINIYSRCLALLCNGGEDGEQFIALFLQGIQPFPESVSSSNRNRCPVYSGFRKTAQKPNQSLFLASLEGNGMGGDNNGGKCGVLTGNGGTSSNGEGASPNEKSHHK